MKSEASMNTCTELRTSKVRVRGLAPKGDEK